MWPIETISWFLSAATFTGCCVQMQKVKLTVTTPNPWGDGYDPGDITISPKVSDRGESLLAVLSTTPPGKIDAGVSDAVLTPADVQANMFMMGVLPSASPQLNAGVVLVPNSAISSIVFSSVPESSTTLALFGTLTLGLVWRRFRRR